MDPNRQNKAQYKVRGIRHVRAKDFKEQNTESDTYIHPTRRGMQVVRRLLVERAADLPNSLPLFHHRPLIMSLAASAED